MKENALEQLLAKYTHCYFVSPHLDDAVLSCGNLMSYLTGKMHMSVLTIFTEAGEGRQETLSAKMFLKQCGIKNAKELFAKRKEEDKTVLELLEASYTHLGYKDALWRKKRSGWLGKILGKIFPEFVHVYPTYRFHITRGRIAKDDHDLMDEIEKSLRASIDANTKNILFFPIGLGKHVDHVITSKMGLRFSENVVFYADFPYCLSDTPNDAYFRERGFQRVEFGLNGKVKHPLIKLYATQPLFSDVIPEVPEVYYVK